MVICYDPNGKAVEKEPIDARECCAHCGFTMEPPDKEMESKNAQVKELAEKVRTVDTEVAVQVARKSTRAPKALTDK